MDIKEKLKVMEEVAEANRQHVEKWKESQKIRGVLVDTVKGFTSPCEIDRGLEHYYEILNCRCIDIVRRTIAGKSFEIICDDEGALVDNPTPSAISPFGAVMLYGNLFIVKHDGKEDVESLTDDEIRHVLHNVCRFFHRTDDGVKVYAAISNVGY